MFYGSVLYTFIEAMVCAGALFAIICLTIETIKNLRYKKKKDKDETGE